MKRSVVAPVAVTLVAVVGTNLYSQAQAQSQTQNQAPRPANSRADETLEMWNEVANKLVAMAQDFPKINMISSCRKTSAPSPKIFCTLPQSTTI